MHEGPWSIEMSREVAKWYSRLRAADKGRVDEVIADLAERGPRLRMPISRPLSEGLFELRFTCEGVERRVTYVFEPERSVIALTTFRKQRSREGREIARARNAARKFKGGV